MIISPEHGGDGRTGPHTGFYRHVPAQKREPVIILIATLLGGIRRIHGGKKRFPWDMVYSSSYDSAEKNELI